MILAVLFLETMPEQSYAGHYRGGCDDCVTFFTSPSSYVHPAPAYTNPIIVKDNPEPYIRSISPSSSNIGVGSKTVTITGAGFVKSSVVKINGVSRPATYIDSSHLLVQITGNDTYKYLANGGFFITVWNSAPGGGSSNAEFFTINKLAPPAVASGQKANYTNSGANQDNNATEFIDTLPEYSGAGGEEDYRNLTSNAIFGANGFLPNSVIQWIMLAILVMAMIIIVRKIFGADMKYHTSPLKHD